MSEPQPAAAPAVHGRPPGERIPAVDIARGLAIIGMFVAHTIALSDSPETLANGRSAIMFATLAGISLGLVSGRDRPIEHDRGRLRTSLAIRGCFLIILGVILALLDTYIAIILDFYGVMFLMVLPLLFLPRSALLAIGLGVAVVMPIINSAVEELYPSVESLPLLVQLPAWWLVLGYYPALTWIAFLLFGLVCARSDLTRPRTQGYMVVAGCAAMLVGYGSAALVSPLTAEAHSDSTAEILGSGGFAIALLGVLLYVTSAGRGAVGRGIRWLFWPFGAMGAMPLTIYTAQIVIIALLSDIVPLWMLLIGLTLGSLVFASVWRPLLGPGALERLVRWISAAGTRQRS